MDYNFNRWNIVNDPFDIERFQRILGSSENLRKTIDPERLATAPELGQDVFDAAYNYLPRLRDEGEVDSAYHFNRGLLEKAMQTTEYDRLRSVTQHDEAASAVATEVIVEDLVENLPDEERQAVNEYAKRRADVGDIQSKLAALKSLPKLTKPLKQAQKGLQGQLPAAQAALQAAQKAFQQAVNSPQAKAVFRAALGKAVEQVQLLNDFAGGWGLEPGQMQKVPAADRLELMRHIMKSEKIRELNRLLGRFKRLAFAKRYTRVTAQPDEVADVEVGNDLARVLPAQFVYLMDPDLEYVFYKKFVGRELLQWKMRGRETFGRGPIIICIDNSGSMTMDAGGVTLEMWAKALGLAMAEVALKDKRTIEFMNFGSYNEVDKTVVEHTLAPAERLRRLIHAAETFFGGGTDFERPLNEALDDVETAEFKRADVIFITDGVAGLSDEFQERFRKVKEAKGFRLHSVIIGGTDETLQAVSDQCLPLYDLLSEGDRVAGAIFESI